MPANHHDSCTHIAYLPTTTAAAPCTLHRHHALKPRPRTRPDWATACALRCSPSGGDTARGELAVRLPDSSPNYIL